MYIVGRRLSSSVRRSLISISNKQVKGKVFSKVTLSNMSSYASGYPDVTVNPAVKQFFEEFYRTSDTPDAHEKYAESFTENAKLVMASKTVNGRSGMIT